MRLSTVNHKRVVLNAISWWSEEKQNKKHTLPEAICNRKEEFGALEVAMGLLGKLFGRLFGGYALRIRSEAALRML